MRGVGRGGRRSGRLLPILAGAALVVLGAGCGGAGGEAPLTEVEEFGKASPDDIKETSEVLIKGRGYQPPTAKVPAGTTITWTQGDPEEHTIVAGNRKEPQTTFDGTVKALGEKFEFTFDTPGSYTYFCRIHVLMDGRIIVE